MGLSIWRLIAAYFKPRGTGDSFGAPERMSGLVLLVIWVIRFSTGWKIRVNHGHKTGGHSKNSQHYKGTALDFHFITETPFYEQILKVEQILKAWQLFDFVGLGIYPDWNTPGFHIDARGSKARWGYINKVVRGVVKTVMVGYDVAKNKAKEVVT